MKRNSQPEAHPNRALLGLTQKEIALILNVSRTHLCHHEANRRNLPSGAGLRLSDMILYMHSPEAKAFKAVDKPEYEDGKTKKILEKRIKENEFQLKVLTRKIESVQEKLEKYKSAAQLMSFLNSPEEVQKAVKPDVVALIESVAIKNLRETKSEFRLLLIDLELLQLQQECINKALVTSTGSV